MSASSWQFCFTTVVCSDSCCWPSCQGRKISWEYTDPGRCISITSLLHFWGSAFGSPFPSRGTSSEAMTQKVPERDAQNSTTASNQAPLQKGTILSPTPSTVHTGLDRIVPLLGPHPSRTPSNKPASLLFAF